MPTWLPRTCLVAQLAVAAAAVAACGDARSPIEPTTVIEPEPPAPTNHEADIAAARPTADAWLELIDAGRYRDAWDLGSSYFKRVVTADELVRAMETERAPLGAVDSRALRDAIRTDSLPGAPDAPYVVFTFQTAFADGATVVETITAEREGGAWLIAGHRLASFGQSARGRFPAAGAPAEALRSAGPVSA